MSWHTFVAQEYAAQKVQKDDCCWFSTQKVAVKTKVKSKAGAPVLTTATASVVNCGVCCQPVVEGEEEALQ